MGPLTAGGGGGDHRLVTLGACAVSEAGRGGGRGAAPLPSHYLSGKGERGSGGGGRGRLPRQELPGRLVGEVNSFAGDHAEEQGEEGGQPGLGGAGQTDRQVHRDRREEGEVSVMVRS